MSAECREPSANWVRIGTFLLRASQIKVAYFDAVRGRLVIQTVAEQELYPF